MDSITSRCCGLFIKDSNKPVPLTAVEYDVQVKSFASQITINQVYKNEEQVDLECIYGFPINDQAAVTGFTVEIDNKTLISHFKRKDEAFQEYTDALSRGDGAYLLDQSDRTDDTFILSVGRLPPTKECRISITYVGTVESVSETMMQLTIPMSLSPRYNPHSADSQQNSVAPPEVYQSSVPYFATLKASIVANDVIKSVTSSTHPLSVTIQSPKEVKLTFGAAQQPLDRDLVILIETQSNPEVHIEVERLGLGQYTAMCSFVPHFEPEESSVKSELIFLVDCSGSMEDNGKIDEARRAMQIFLRSIPAGCVFNFYRFGSTFQSLFPTSQLYSSESFEKAKVYAKETRANLGGTEILEPLRKIYSDKIEAGYARQLFVLTDGDVTNTEEVIQLVAHNASTTRVFAYGLGDSPSRSLVNGFAMAGNGKAEFIKQGEVLEEKIGRHLSRALQPAVTKASVLWDGLSNVQQVPTTLPPVFNNDRLLVYAFFEQVEGSTQPSVTFQIGKKIMQKEFSLGDAKTGGFLDKLAARALIKEMETTKGGIAQQGSRQKRGVSPTENEDEKKRAEKITGISLQYGVMSKYVSLVAVEQRSENERASSGTIELREVPVQKTGMESRGPERYAAAMGGGGRSRGGGAMRHRRAFMCQMAYQPESYAFDEMMSVVSRAAMSDSCVDDAEQSEQTADKPATGSDLTSLLELQRWDGTWNAGQELQQITRISLHEVRTALSKDDSTASLLAKLSDDVIATLFAVVYIRGRFADQKGTWEQIVNKAQSFLTKNVDQALLTTVTDKIALFIEQSAA